MKKYFISVSVFVLLSISDILIASISDNLIAYYPFNGNANDESINSNDGTVYGAIEISDRFGKENSAYLFDGDNDYIDLVSGMIHNLPQISFFAWVNIYSLNSGGSVISASKFASPSDCQEILHINPDTIFIAQINCTSGYANLYYDDPSVVTNQWLFIGYIYDGSTFSAYFNGKKVESTGFSKGNISEVGGVTIGRRVGGGYQFNGRIDDVRIYNRALTEMEIDSLYHENDYQCVSFTKITDGDIVSNGGNSNCCSWGDYNNDGFTDLYVTNREWQNNFLYENNGNGTFSRITSGVLVTDGGFSMSSSWGDYNNDGYLDLFVANSGSTNRNNFIFQNNEDYIFTKITDGIVVNDNGYTQCGSWIDYNNDGFLDIFVTNDNSQNNCLYKGDGSGNFIKITSGEIVNDGTLSFGFSWTDVDNDNDGDLIVCCGSASNIMLYKNNGDETFTKISSTAITNEKGNSASWGDYDNDGDQDLFISWIETNCLFKNNGEWRFDKILTGDIINDNEYSLCGEWGDYDNDGDLDLFIANNGENTLYSNNGDGNFTKIKNEITTDTGSSQGCSWVDYNNDGNLDLFIANCESNNSLYINNGTKKNWININCNGILSNASGIGAKVRVKVLSNGTAIWQLREVTGQYNGHYQNLQLHFGLGDATAIDSIKIEWPSGIVQVLTGVSVNQFLTITEPALDYTITHWKFDEMEGDNLLDVSGKGHDGVIYSATWAEGYNSTGALKFNGSSDYVQINHNDHLELPDSITVEAIIKPGLTGGRIVNKDNQYASDPNRSYFLSVDKYSDEQYAISWRVYSTPNVGGEQINYFTVLDTGKWYHIAGTFDENHLRIYFNKTLVVDSTFNYVRNKGTSPLYIGRPNYGNMWFDGHIDEIRISSNALSPYEFLEFEPEYEGIFVSLPEIAAFYNDTILIPVDIEFPSEKIHDSAELKFSGYQNSLEFIGVDTASSMTGDAGWSYAVNETGDSLIISWFAGSEDISGSGVFCRLKFVAIGEPCNFVPINIESALFNIGGYPVSINNGGIYIKPTPFYGDVDSNGGVQAHDAALILKHLIGIDTLFCQGLANADVTDDGTVSALDASVILQYGVGLISDLPYDSSVNGSLMATGEFLMEEEIGTLGGIFELPILVENGSNIYSFEGCLEYNPEHLIFSELSLPTDKSNYQIQVLNNDGKIRWVGAGTNPDGTDGTFITALFSYNPLATISNTTVYLSKIRVNEEFVYSNVGQTVVYNLVGIAYQNKLPSEFALDQNYPNPFNPTTVIEYALSKTSNVQISIFDVNGRVIDKLVNKTQQPGYYSIQFDASSYSSGVYFYQILAGDFQQVKKCLLLK